MAMMLPPRSLQTLLLALGERQRWALLGTLASSIAVGVLGLAPAFVAGDFIDMIRKGEFGSTPGLAWLLLAATAIFGIFNAVEGLLTTFAGERFGKDLRVAMLDAALRLPMPFYRERSAGELLNRVDNDVDMIVLTYVHSLEPAVSAGIAFLATLIVMFSTDWRLTLLALATVPLWVYATKPAAGRLQQLQSRLVAARDAFLGNSAEILSFQGAALVKTLNAYPQERHRFEETFMHVLNLRLASALVARCIQSVLMCIIAAAPALLLGVGAYLVSKHLTSIGTLVAFLSLQTRLYTPIGQFTNLRLDLAGLAAIWPRIEQILCADPERDAGKASPATWALSANGTTCSIDGVLLFDPVTFSVPVGAYAALVGPSGVGKSSLVWSMLRLHGSKHSGIGVGALDLDDIPLAELRDNIALVTQESYFFSRSIRANLSAASPHADDREIFKMLRITDAARIVEAMPAGLDTVVGNGNVKLSGGEAQRLSLSRALLKHPRILILDEATSALDVESEKTVMARLRAGFPEMTIIHISHRPEIISEAEVVIHVSASGRVSVAT